MQNATTTDDPELRVVADGRLVAACRVDSVSYGFDLPGPVAELRIVSRSVVPSALDPAHPDGRRLGVSILRLALRGVRLDLFLRFDDPALTDGFHRAEDGFRWTDGDARLPASLLAAFTEPFALEIVVQQTGLRYPLPPPPRVEQSPRLVSRMRRA